MTTPPDAVDPVTRKEYAALLRHLAVGLITNREFEMRTPDWHDTALDEINWAMLPLYGDDYEHKLAGEYRLGRDSRQSVARTILFLRSDMRYRWPRQTGCAQGAALVLSLLTLGRFGRWWWRHRAPDGDESVWPFYTRAEYEQALRNPPYLRGAQVI